jgi:glycosyltransferase involved in cell wall biosynthesis
MGYQRAAPLGQKITFARSLIVFLPKSFLLPNLQFFYPKVYMPQPKVSVIVPNYNHAPYLPKRIESILLQSYQDFELIILDDCSTDNSQEVIEKYRTNAKVSHIVYNTTNSGSTFRQWKKGMELAQGQYIWIAESDDYADSALLSTLLPQIEKQAVGMAYCRSYIVVEDKVKNLATWGETINPTFWEQDQVMESREVIENYLQYRNIMLNASAILFRKESLVLTDNILQMRYAGDWAAWLSIASKYKVAFCATPLNYFRNHAQTTRRLQLYEKEVQRIHECLAIVKQAQVFTKQLFNPFHRNYEWLIDEWFRKYKHFSYKQGFFPPFPFLFVLRFYLYLVQNTLQPIIDLRHKIQLRTRLKKLLSN